MVKIHENAELSNGSSAHYTATDFSLEVTLHYPAARVANLSEGIDQKFGIAPNSAPLLVNCGGTLTITFAGPEKILSSIDSYTNKSKWIEQKLVLPSGPDRGLCLYEGPETDRISVQDDPKYFFDPVSNVLKIVLIEGRPEAFYTLSDTLIIGVSDGRVSSIYISSLSVK